MTWWKELAELFVLHRRAQGLADRTIKDYEDHLRWFYGKTRPKEVGDLKMAVLKYFADNKLKAATFNTRRRRPGKNPEKEGQPLFFTPFIPISAPKEIERLQEK